MCSWCTTTANVDGGMVWGAKTKPNELKAEESVQKRDLCGSEALDLSRNIRSTWINCRTPEDAEDAEYAMYEFLHLRPHIRRPTCKHLLNSHMRCLAFVAIHYIILLLAAWSSTAYVSILRATQTHNTSSENAVRTLVGEWCLPPFAYDDFINTHK